MYFLNRSSCVFFGTRFQLLAFIRQIPAFVFAQYALFEIILCCSFSNENTFYCHNNLHMYGDARMGYHKKSPSNQIIIEKIFL